MTKKPAFWIVLLVLALGSSAFSWQYFGRAFPLVSIDIAMDREEALERAAALAAARQLGPAEAQAAASFSLDATVQSFVELEGGGKPAFAALVRDTQYTPYRWRVRRFRERDTQEATFTFAPDGTPNGFAERLPEDAAGAALSAEAAREIAESTSTGIWNVDLASYRAVEQAEERRTGGRIDHTFVYESEGRQLGEGRYRLRLVVSGDRLTELRYFIRVPDAFNRRFEQMRSVNEAIGIGASIAFLLIYGAGGIAFGLFVLARQRWVIWKTPVVWGVIVALMQTIARVNEWPLVWMTYDTALSSRSFLAQQIGLALVELVTNVVLFSLSFMAAESLTRRAFPRHPQLWRVWGRQGGASPAIAGRTIAGYLLVPIFLAYEVALYFVATRWLGWWTPSEALSNPDVLASYLPWYSAIARSFQAGFWEEALFRAVPIAGAALIGERFGYRRAWIVLAFAVQIVIFGAGHAAYPTQPAYARPVELILPSIGFGLLYLWYGLLPAVILHFTFDVIWFAMPLFAATGSGILFQQFIVVLVTLVPLWVVGARWLAARRAGAAAGVETDRLAPALNAEWQPAPVVEEDVRPARVETAAGLRPAHVRWILVAGSVAAVVWIVVSMSLPVQRHPLEASRADALAAARTALASRSLGPEWQFVAVADQPADQARRFVWTTAGRTTYESLLGTYLPRPGWRVLVRTFTGDVAERAESWEVRLDASGRVEQVSHRLPESRPAASLDEAAARALARRAVTEQLGIDAASLRDVSAVPAKLPARTDWTITFADPLRTLPEGPRLPDGERRLTVRIMGDEIAEVRRFVFVPEAWERADRNAQTIATVIGGAGTLLGIVMVIAGTIAAVVSWSRRRFEVRHFLAVGGGLIVLAGIRVANTYPSLLAQLSTAQPLQLQLLVLIGAGAVGVALQAIAIGLVAGGAAAWAASGRIDRPTALRVGLALGAIGAGVSALGALGYDGPRGASYAGAAAFVPFLDATLQPAMTMVMRTALLLLIVAAAGWLTAGWTRNRALAGALIVLAGGLMGASGSPLNVAAWIASAALAGAALLAAYLLVLRHDVSVVPPAVAVLITASTLFQGSMQAYPAALPGAMAGCAVMWAGACLWFRALSRPQAADRAASDIPVAV